MTAHASENNYRVIERIAAGGMAEVFRAESESVGDFRKSVAIKRVHPSLAHNERFIRMFLDEARLSAHLNHRNIVQVFDVGRDHDAYFIVMEYVEGVTLKAVMEHARKRGKALAVPLAVHVAIELCAALQYAHTLTDAEGQPLGIVHRDVSPSNVLLARSGGVKIVDFGVAKATTQIEKTDPGVVKGKLDYLAPELTEGQAADPKADQFATGVVLWEMLAGRSLFGAKSDIETVQNLRAAQIPSLRELNPDVPEALERVIATALARDKAERYPDLAALGRALREVQFEHRMPVDAEDLGKLVAEVMAVARGAAAPSPGQGVNSILGIQRAEPALSARGPTAFSILSLVRDRGRASPPTLLPPSAEPPATAVEPVPGPAAEQRSSGRAVAVGAVAVAIAVGAFALVRAYRTPRAVTAATNVPPARVLVVADGGGGGATAAAPGPTESPDVAAPDASAQASAGDAALAPVQDVPSWVERSAVFHAAQQQVYGCSERYGAQGRHARVFVTYSGATGAVTSVRINGAFFARGGPVGQCIERAVRAHPVYPFRAAQWSTDYEFAVP